MKNREILCDAGYEESAVLENPDYDSAIVGVTDEGNVVYDFWKMVDYLMEHDGMEMMEAVEFIEFNTIRAPPYAGEKAPVVITMLKDLI